MYVEMTTFAVPTFLLVAFKAAAFFALCWIIGAFIGAWLYDRSVTKAIHRARDNEKCAARKRGERILK